MYPKLFNDLVDSFKKLPGVGHKTAIRYAFKALEFDDAQLLAFSKQLMELKNTINHCERCGFLCDDKLCSFCKDETRDASQLLVVSYVQDVLTIEKTKIYKGYYHVLGGSISPTKGIMPKDLNIDKLLDRLNGVKEVIIAISTTVDGEMTSLYLAKLLKNFDCKVTRFANGLAYGTNIDYVDEETIERAFGNRTKIE